MRFPFDDLDSFIAFVVFVRISAPNIFPPLVTRGPDGQWTLALAFEGLRTGLKMVEEQIGSNLADCAYFIDEAEKSYCAGDPSAGRVYLQNLLKRLPPAVKREPAALLTRQRA